MFLLFVGATTVATWLWPSPPAAPRHDGLQETEILTGEDISAFGQVLHIWLPAPLLELAKCRVASGWPRDHEELRDILENAEDEDLRYAFSLRCYQSNTNAVDVAYIREPNREPWRFKELLEILATASGSPPLVAATDYSTADVHIISPGTSRSALSGTIRASIRLP